MTIDTPTGEEVPKCWFCNLSFDLHAQKSYPTRLQRLITEGQYYFVPIAKKNHWVILDEPADPEYLAYLRMMGLDPPELTASPLNRSQLRAVPWGWDEEALARFSIHSIRVHHPPLEVIRQVNSRNYCYSMGQKLGLIPPECGRCHNESEILHWLSAHPHIDRWVLKPQFGNAGIGFIHLTDGHLTPKVLHTLRSKDDDTYPLIVEPWYHRLQDFSIRFELLPLGEVKAVRWHRTLVNNGGVFHGMIIQPHCPACHPFIPQFEQLVQAVSKELHRSGYWGAVGIDSFSYRDQRGRIRLRPLVEINAREVVSTIAYGLQQQLACAPFILFRFVPARRYKLHSIRDYKHLLHSLGNECFQSRRGTGIIILNPLSIPDTQGSKRLPQRLMILIAGNSEEELRWFDLKLITRLGKYA